MRLKERFACQMPWQRAEFDSREHGVKRKETAVIMCYVPPWTEEDGPTPADSAVPPSAQDAYPWTVTLSWEVMALFCRLETRQGRDYLSVCTPSALSITQPWWRLSLRTVQAIIKITPHAEESLNGRFNCCDNTNICSGKSLLVFLHHISNLGWFSLCVSI